MDFVRDKVAEFHHVDVANHDFLVERIASAAVEQTRFTGLLHPTETFFLARVLQVIADFAFLNSVEHRGRNFKSERFGGDAEVCFQNLADIHTARNAEWIQDDLDWSAIRQERHVFFWNNARDDAFVSVTARHFVAN